eukprot:SAG11_NODE_29004_length_315_cov_1.194444_1_plen_31_part_10
MVVRPTHKESILPSEGIATIGAVARFESIEY